MAARPEVGVAPVRTAWRVLLVDDSPDDAELAAFALREGGVDARCLRVSSADALREALSAFAPDAVVSDVNLPGFSGAEALALVRALAPALPFVFLTGALMPGDDGPPPADGLLLKDQLDALPALLRRLLGG